MHGQLHADVKGEPGGRVGEERVLVGGYVVSSDGIDEAGAERGGVEGVEVDYCVNGRGMISNYIQGAVDRMVLVSLA